jgi:hypothetical protein
MTRYSNPQDGISTTELCSQLYVFLRWVVCGDNLACMVIKGFQQVLCLLLPGKVGLRKLRFGAYIEVMVAAISDTITCWYSC